MDQETVMKRFSSGGTFAGALIAVMLLAPPQNCWAQSVGTNPLAGRISIMNLGRRAAFDRPDERALQAVAPLAPKPGGGAYILWATAEGWNRGFENVTSTVFVTEVDGQRNIVGDDINLGRGQPMSIVATNDGFACFVKDDHKLTLLKFAGHQRTGELVLMGHGNGTARPTTFRHGVDLRPLNNGQFPHGWAVPYAPFNRGHGGMAFGNGIIGATFGIWNNYQPSGHRPPDGNWSRPDDAHNGSTAWFFGNDPAQNYHMAYSTGDHSLDQRMIFDGSSFYSLSLNPHLVFQRFDSQGNRSARTVLFDQPVKYVRQDGSTEADDGAMEVQDRSGTWQRRTGFVEASGYTLGRLGDLHALGSDRFALTYGYAAWTNNRNLRSGKNQVDFAVLDGNGHVITRRIIAEADSRAGQNGFTEYKPYERIKWVKSVTAGNNILIVWATEYHDLSRNYPTYMALVDVQGSIVSGPHAIPHDMARFSFNDRLQALSDGTIAWTYTGNGSLWLYLLSP
ncbi:MAG: hypothetical protein KDA81_13525 [Planctomycetaceae bacterium]|nr:hypothetical protein [Planctomycetaceae bacterium]